MAAVRGLRAVQLVVLYPLQGWSSITPVQEAQMTQLAGGNVHLVGVEGSSDDLDVPIEVRPPTPETPSPSPITTSTTRAPTLIAALTPKEPDPHHPDPPPGPPP